MTKITLKAAQAKLPELIAGLKPGQSLVITDKKKPVAKLVSALPKKKPARRKLGGSEHLITFIADDFNSPLELGEVDQARLRAKPQARVVGV